MQTRHVTHAQLVVRAHGQWARPGSTGEYSLRLTCDGRTCFFPLDTSDERLAWTRSRRIQKEVAQTGWETITRRIPREFTFAICWWDRPMVFTYSTLYTLSTSSRTTSTKSGTPRRPSTQVAFVVLEPDSLRRKALVHWAGRLSGYECKGAFASVQEAIPFLDRSGASLDLLLYHRQLADLPQTTLKRLLERCDGHLLAVSYHTYDNSDELFFSQPGISEGYYFRRRTPDQILEPLDALWQLRPVPKQAYATELSRYVNRVFTGFDTRPKPIGGAELTARETQILRCLSEGLADKEISVRLQISTWTVHTHLKRIYQKLKVRSRTEAVIRHSQM